MRCLRQIAHIKWRSQISPAEMSNYRHRIVSANSATPMNRPSAQDDFLCGGQRKRYKAHSRLISPCLTLTRLTLRVWQQTGYRRAMSSINRHFRWQPRVLTLRTGQATPAHPLLLQTSVTCADGLVAPHICDRVDGLIHQCQAKPAGLTHRL